MIKCSKCDATKPIEEFWKSEQKRRRNRPRCIPCMKSYKEPETPKKPFELDLDETNMTSTAWQGGKYQGTIMENIRNTANNKFYVRVNGKEKSFKYSSENKEEVRKEAQDWKRKQSDECGLTTNKYKLIYGSNNTPEYIIVQLSKGYVTLCDFDMLDFVKTHRLCVSKSGRETAPHYCAYSEDGKVPGFHSYVTKADLTDHISGYPLDNRKKNLSNATISENSINRSYIHKTYIIKTNNKIEGTIVHNGKCNCNEKKVISKWFDDVQTCNTWIDLKSKDIDQDLFQKLPYRLELREDYERIMEQHAGGFHWKEPVEIKNITKTD